MLKSRFPILRWIPHHDTARIRELIVALMYVHNFLENQKDGWRADPEEPDNEDNGPEQAAPANDGDAEAEAAAGTARRQQIVDYLADLAP